MNIYVVCMDSSWVRDSQMFDLARYGANAVHCNYKSGDRK